MIYRYVLIGVLGVVFTITGLLAKGVDVNKYLAFMGIAINAKSSPAPVLKSGTVVSKTLSPIPKVTEVTVKVTPKVTPINNKVSPLSPSLSPLSPQVSPLTADNQSPVVINEIAWMGTGSTLALSVDEWMELYNPGSNQMDITGWTLKSLTGTNPDPQITLSGIIPAQSYFLLERTDNTTVSNIEANQTYTGALSDGCEILELRDNTGNIRDLTSCSGSVWYAGDKDSRSSMERIDPYKSGNNPVNWGTNNGQVKNGLNKSGEPINGTPGANNSVAGS